MTVHADNVPTALITVKEACNTRALIESWLHEIEECGGLGTQKDYQFYRLFDRLETNIERENCDTKKRLVVRELHPDAMEIFNTIIVWANKTCPEHFKKLRQSMN